jgi:hypothetical protein
MMLEIKVSQKEIHAGLALTPPIGDLRGALLARELCSTLVPTPDGSNAAAVGRCKRNGR